MSPNGTGNSQAAKPLANYFLNFPIRNHQTTHYALYGTTMMPKTIHLKKRYNSCAHFIRHWAKSQTSFNVFLRHFRTLQAKYVNINSCFNWKKQWPHNVVHHVICFYWWFKFFPTSLRLENNEMQWYHR